MVKKHALAEAGVRFVTRPNPRAPRRPFPRARPQPVWRAERTPSTWARQTGENAAGGFFQHSQQCFL